MKKQLFLFSLILFSTILKSENFLELEVKKLEELFSRLEASKTEILKDGSAPEQLCQLRQEIKEMQEFLSKQETKEILDIETLSEKLEGYDDFLFAALRGASKANATTNELANTVEVPTEFRFSEFLAAFAGSVGAYTLFYRIF